MDEKTDNIWRYLLLPEDVSCEGAGCMYPWPVRAYKAVLWITISILFGLGLARICSG